MVERLKRNDYTNFGTNYYFWRTYEQQEIDLIEENGGKLYGFEFKGLQKIRPHLKYGMKPTKTQNSKK